MTLKKNKVLIEIMPPKGPLTGERASKWQDTLYIFQKSQIPTPPEYLITEQQLHVTHSVNHSLGKSLLDAHTVQSPFSRQWGCSREPRLHRMTHKKAIVQHTK